MKEQTSEYVGPAESIDLQSIGREIGTRQMRSVGSRNRQ